MERHVPASSSPLKWPQRPALGWYKGRCQELLHVSHMGEGIQTLGPFLSAFPGLKQGSGWEVKLLGHDQSLFGMLMPRAKDYPVIPLHPHLPRVFFFLNLHNSLLNIL